MFSKNVCYVYLLIHLLTNTCTSGVESVTFLVFLYLSYLPPQYT